MDIHKPKAAHSWREFLTEIGAIVCGILIAIRLERRVALISTAQVNVGRGLGIDFPMDTPDGHDACTPIAPGA